MTGGGAVNVRIVTKATISLCICILGFQWAAAETLNDDPLHDKAVNTAREGNPREGLAILQSILDKNPSNYPVRRDVVIIATWADDCDLALKNYKLIQDAPDQESYLLIPVSECLVARDRQADAIVLLEKAREAVDPTLLAVLHLWLGHSYFR
ncbi:MAG: hypothetical protein R3240_12780, partial [Gammaproteobacteria bacterium]|nr:hypothetical protein [Gammaproteobacteria bacterium]